MCCHVVYTWHTIASILTEWRSCLKQSTTHAHWQAWIGWVASSTNSGLFTLLWTLRFWHAEVTTNHILDIEHAAMLFIHCIPLPPYQQNGTAILNSLHSCPLSCLRMITMQKLDDGMCASWHTSIMSPFLVRTLFLALFHSEQLCRSESFALIKCFIHNDTHLF